MYVKNITIQQHCKHIFGYPPVQRCRTVSRRSVPALAGRGDPAESACNGHSKNIPQLRANAAHHTSSGLGQCLW